MSDENETSKQAPGNGAAPQHGAQQTTSAPPAVDAHAETEADPGDDAAEFETAADVGADPVAVLSLKVETLESQIADLTGRLLRAHADLDNLRKRAEREKQETARFAISAFAKDTVGLVDNFERAMQAVDAAAVESDPHLKALLEGVAMTEREFLNVLDRHGVKRMEPKGEAFDPRLHQAVMERHDASFPNGTVVEVFQAGYTIAERCLRPAIVVVSRGGARATAKPAAEEEPAASEPGPAPQDPAETSAQSDQSSPRPQASASGPAENPDGSAGEDGSSI